MLYYIKSCGCMMSLTDHSQCCLISQRCICTESRCLTTVYVILTLCASYFLYHRGFSLLCVWHSAKAHHDKRVNCWHSKGYGRGPLLRIERYQVNYFSLHWWFDWQTDRVTDWRCIWQLVETNCCHHKNKTRRTWDEIIYLLKHVVSQKNCLICVFYFFLPFFLFLPHTIFYLMFLSQVLSNAMSSWSLLTT